ATPLPCPTRRSSDLDDYGVTGVLPAVWFDDVVNTTAEQIRCFTLALVAPLGTHDCDCWHKIHLSQGDGIRLSRNIERFSHPQHVGIGSRTVTARVYQITVRAADCEGSSSSWPITPRLAPARR